VDAGIGAARALRQGFFAGEVFESGHQRPLNGQSVGLDLPSGEIMAVIREREFEIARHGAPDVASVRKTKIVGLFSVLTLFNALKQR